MNRKALFFDVDGTLVDNETKEAPQSAIDAIDAARADGHLVFINSGRVACLMDRMREVFHLNDFLCGCGTHIIVDDKTVMERRIPMDRGIEIRKLLLKYNIECILEAQQGIYFSERPFKYPDVMDFMYEYITDEIESLVHEDSLRDDSFIFDKICIQTDPLFPREDLDGFFKELYDFTPINRGRGFYECVPTGYSKGTAVNYVLEHYNVSPDDAYVFGDSMNDESMFTSGAAHRILMERHDTDLEKYATLITGDVMHDGIADAMKKLHIITG